MPLHIPDGCNARKAVHNDQLVWLITTTSGDKFFARQTTTDEWHAWSSLALMDEGEDRVIMHDTKLSYLIEDLDRLTRPLEQGRVATLTPKKESMMPDSNQNVALQNLRKILTRIGAHIDGEENPSGDAIIADLRIALAITDTLANDSRELAA